MALVFPLSREAFLDRLPVQPVRFACPAQNQATGLGGGEILTAEIAPALWSGSFNLAPMRARAAAEVETLLDALSMPGASFLAFKKNQIGPAADPLGAALAGFNPTIKTVDFAASTLQLQALPIGYQLSVGDFLSFAYGSDPVRRALHRVQEVATANVTGYTNTFQIFPHLRPDALVGTAVTLVKPYCKAVIVPGSVNEGTTKNGKTTGIAFSFRQSLR
jgi:hypothetical protein